MTQFSLRRRKRNEIIDSDITKTVLSGTIHHNEETLNVADDNLSTFIEPTVKERHKLNFSCVIKPIFCVVFNHFEKHIFLCVVELFLGVIQLHSFLTSCSCFMDLARRIYGI